MHFFCLRIRLSGEKDEWSPSTVGPDRHLSSYCHPLQSGREHRLGPAAHQHGHLDPAANQRIPCTGPPLHKHFPAKRIEGVFMINLMQPQNL